MKKVIDKLTMFQMAVRDMPRAKEFYEEKLGLKVATDYRRDDSNWWVSLEFAEGGVTMTLTTHHAHMKPGGMTLYFATSDIAAAHEELRDRGAEVADIDDDLHGPGSGVKWFSFEDPDGNLIHLEQA